MILIRKVIDYIKLSFCFCNIRKQKLRICEAARWKASFFRYLCNLSVTSSDYINRWDVIEGFAKSNIIMLKEAYGMRITADPILVCVVRDEIERIEGFLSHYRKIGIKRFAIIDNGSKDGTVKYLYKQQDVDLFCIKDQFGSRVKVGWINRIISYYGTKHWFLVVDADEFLVWQGVEESSVQDVVQLLYRKNISRARAIMIDMYSKEPMQGKEETFETAFERYRYFDDDTYYHRSTEEVYLICGGPRKRVLDADVWLTKYPLFKLKGSEFMSNPHTIYPYENKKSVCFFALLHYKFLTQKDFAKVKKYAREGNYAGGSAEYKLYMKKLRDNCNIFNFYYERSKEYVSSQDLGLIEEIDKIPLKL